MTADLDIGPLPGIAPGSRGNRPAAFPLLRPRLPRQQGRDGLARREAAFDDGQHGAADGQVHAQRLGAGHDGGAAGHAFGDVAQGGQDVGQGLALGQQKAHAPVAGQIYSDRKSVV